jgi:hypothetical protein
MSENFVRVRVRCKSCRHASLLSPDHYKLLVRGSRLELYCPRCARPLAFDPLGATTPKPVSRAAQPSAVDAPPCVAAKQETPPPAPAAPAFPPPPFAPLGAPAANPLPTGAAAPAFAPLGTGPSAPAPFAFAAQAGAVAPAGETTKLTLNDRWKRLPSWAQWLVIGAVIVVLAVVIFAMPTGGSNNQEPAEGTRTTQERKP